ncbi:Uncharacterised protein [Vibrio vulnificus]|nr:hypothetical protein VVS222_01236 [Vibrio vulnificus]OJI44163.1 hypothetical protein VVATL9824_03095 [Vibrio vulnificus]SUP39430.1 Uncharacterised protein [Vibrio vulnificus]
MSASVSTQSGLDIEQSNKQADKEANKTGYPRVACFTFCTKPLVGLETSCHRNDVLLPHA